MMFDRIEREKRTVAIMIDMYCNKHHMDIENNCQECAEVTQFAVDRIDKCLFHEDKPVCSECQVHCYRKDMREKIRIIMRYAGPRMLFKHPWLGIRHLLDKRFYKYIDPKTYKSLKNN